MHITGGNSVKKATGRVILTDKGGFSMLIVDNPNERGRLIPLGLADFAIDPRAEREKIYIDESAHNDDRRSYQSAPCIGCPSRESCRDKETACEAYWAHTNETILDHESKSIPSKYWYAKTFGYCSKVRRKKVENLEVNETARAIGDSASIWRQAAAAGFTVRTINTEDQGLLIWRES
jgi:hypothetical protein